MSDISTSKESLIDANATRVVSIRMVRCEYEIERQAVANLQPSQYQAPVEFRVDRTYPAPNVLEVLVGLAVFRESKERPFRLFVDYIGRFETDLDHVAALQAFAKYNAVAMLIPHLREAAASLTMRSGIPPFLLDPINVPKLVDLVDHHAGSRKS